MDNTTELNEVINNSLSSDSKENNSLEEEAKKLGISLYGSSEEKKDYSKKLVVDVKETTKELALKKKLIPKNYIDASFSKERIERNIEEMNVATKNIYRVEKLDNYIKMCYSLLSTFRTGNVPESSFIIGAPNGFGKTSFANESIMIMEEKGMKTVPYISLFDLAQIRANEEKRLMREFSYKRYTGSIDTEKYIFTEPETMEFTKVPAYEFEHYSWSEYMNSDCLICYLTSVSCRQIESRTLYEVLNTRATKGLPTIVMTASSLVPYTRDIALKEQVWDEILTSRVKKRCYDRLYHTSCYKVTRNSILEERERGQ